MGGQFAEFDSTITHASWRRWCLQAQWRVWHVDCFGCGDDLRIQPATNLTCDRTLEQMCVFLLPSEERDRCACPRGVAESGASDGFVSQVMDRKGPLPQRLAEKNT